jgi:hypothetical protein
MSKLNGTVSSKELFRHARLYNSIIFGQTRKGAVDLTCILPIMPMTNEGQEFIESTLCYEQ